MKKSKLGMLFANTVMGIGGIVSAAVSINLIGAENIYENGIKGLLFGVIACVAIILVSQFIQTIAHEFGHLVFGLLSGYKFTSFRIGHFMFIDSGDKIKIKVFNVVGTGGQCLMMPPDWEKGVPFRLYNLGGCIMNIIFAGIGGICFLFIPAPGFISAFFFSLFVLGIAMAIVNGVPLEVGNISNDGKNAFLLGKDETSLRAFWLQLYVNGLMAKGERIGTMPEEWFFLPEGDYRNDPVVCTIGVFRFNYYFDRHEFEKAEETAQTVLTMPGLLGVHRNELLCELVFLRIFRGAPSNEIDPMLSARLRKYIRATSSYASRKRLDFAYQLLYKRNPILAEKCLADFEKVVKTYPYASEIANEREIIEMIKEKNVE